MATKLKDPTSRKLRTASAPKRDLSREQAALPTTLCPRLNGNERRSLAKCERVIQTGIRTVFEVGAALLEIRDKELFRESHETFAAYVEERWDFTRQRAYQLIDGSRVREQLAAPTAVGAGRKKRSASPLPAPENEAQVRPLLSVDEDHRPEVWSQAVAVAKAAGREKPTAAIVADTVRAWVTPPDELPAAKRPAAAEPVAPSADRCGCPDPASWARACDALEQQVQQMLIGQEEWPGARRAMIDLLELLIERVEEE